MTYCSTRISRQWWTAAVPAGAPHQLCFQAWHCQIAGRYGKDAFSCCCSVHAVTRRAHSATGRSQGCLWCVMANDIKSTQPAVMYCRYQSPQHSQDFCWKFNLLYASVLKTFNLGT